MIVASRERRGGCQRISWPAPIFGVPAASFNIDASAHPDGAVMQPCPGHGAVGGIYKLYSETGSRTAFTIKLLTMGECPLDRRN